MYTEIEIYKLGIYSERVHRLAFDIAMQAGLLGENGIAVVADETRNIGIDFCKAVEQIKTTGKTEIDMVEKNIQLKTLAINGGLEMLRVSNYQKGACTTMPLAVIFDEISGLSNEISALLKQDSTKQSIIPRVSKKNTVLQATVAFMTFTAGGVDFVENVQYVKEVVRVGMSDQSAVKGGVLKLRGQDIPVVDLAKRSGTADKDCGFMLIVDLHDNEEKRVAIPLDTLPQIFRTMQGIGVSCEYKGTLPKECVRECWDAEENHQMIFLEYSKLKN